jgi:hypothetical protein
MGKRKGMKTPKQDTARARIKRIKAELKMIIQWAEDEPRAYQCKTYADGLRRALKIVMEESQ